MNKRLQEFDVLRVAAALAVIAIHVTAGYIDKSSLAYLWNHVVRFAVPLFIVISGFLLYHTDRDAPVLSPLSFYRKRLKRILWPFFIWSFIYCLFSAYLLRWNNPILFLVTWGKSLLWGNAYYHLYFLPIILQFYLLYPLLRRWLLKKPRQLFAVCLLLTLACQILLYLYLLHIISLPYRYNSLYLLSFPVWLFYFVLGMFTAYECNQCTGRTGLLMHRLISLQTYQEKRPPITLAVIWLMSLAIVILDSKLTNIQGSIVRPSVMLYTACSYFFFYALAMQFRQKDRPWLTWISAQSFLIFLMHPFLLTILIKVAPRLGYPSLWDGNLGLIGLYCATTAVTIAITYFVSLTPMAELLGGIKKSGR